MQPTANQLEIVRQLWNLRGEIKFIRRVENFVYEATIDGRPVILRLTEPRHRTALELESELDWIHFLSSSGLRVAAPIASSNDSFVETITAEQTLHACVFEKALGSPLKEPQEFSPQNIQSWGAYVGTMHRITRNYQPQTPVQRRSLWKDDAGFQVTLQGVDASDAIPFQRFHKLLTWVQALPTSGDCFGLVHCDMHHGNFFVHDGQITAFDFDDSVYHWFAYDVAIPLYGLLRLSANDGLIVPYDEAYDHFAAGYCGENQLEQVWIDRIPLFIRFRTATVYHWAKEAKADGVFDEATLPWYEATMSWSRQQLESELELF